MTIRGRWAWVLLTLLVLSLSVNLFAGGLLAGRFVAEPRMAGMHHGGPFAGGLPKKARGPVREAFLAHRDELGQQMAAIREARRRVILLLREPELDESALDAAFVELRERSAAAQALIQTIMREAALRLPPEARAAWRPRLLGGPDGH